MLPVHAVRTLRQVRPQSPYYTPPATIPCLACGGEVDPATGACRACGQVAFAPVGTGRAGGEAPRHARGGGRRAVVAGKTAQGVSWGRIPWRCGPARFGASLLPTGDWARRY